MKFKLDWFLIGMGAAVALAWLFPAPGAAGGWMHPELLTKAGFPNGFEVKLSYRDVVRGYLRTAHANALQAARLELLQADAALQSELKAELEQANCALNDHETAQKNTLQQLRQELRKADADLREELRQVMQRLTDDKTDRSMLGELFIELGNHVKSGGSLSDILQGLDQPG